MGMNYRCFMLEKINERVEHLPERECCPGDDSCDAILPEEDQAWFDIRRADTGEILNENVYHWYSRPGETFPPGAMWWQDMSDGYHPTGPDDWSDKTPAELETLKAAAARSPELYERRGILPTGLPVRQPSYLFTGGPQLHVMTPGGLWVITSRASNCGLPYDYEHRCWVIAGEPPNLTVTKDGPTCAAGAGSIQCGDYHGFLRNGELVP